jgi:hypothetical protein
MPAPGRSEIGRWSSFPAPRPKRSRRLRPPRSGTAC